MLFCYCQRVELILISILSSILHTCIKVSRVCVKMTRFQLVKIKNGRIPNALVAKISLNLCDMFFRVRVVVLFSPNVLMPLIYV